MLDGDDLGQMIYLVLLGAMVGAWFFTSARQSANKTLQQAALWALIFIGVIAAYGMWGDIRQTVTGQAQIDPQTKAIELTRAPDGHYYTWAQVNDVQIEFIVDTGASGVVLTQEDAEKAGIPIRDLAFVSHAETAGGPVKIALTKLTRFGIKGAEQRNFTASVNKAPMPQSLMGMTYLQHFSSVTLANGRMVLQP